MRRLIVRVFISFAKYDADLAAQLENALRREGIETWSSLDVTSGEDWKAALDRESATADGFLFLLGAGASVDPQLQAEWRSLLRNDLDSKKPLIPIVPAQSAQVAELPPFLRNRRIIAATNFDRVIDELRYLVEHPSETIDRTREQQSKAEQDQRFIELKDYALSLKQGNANGEPRVQ